MTCAPMSWAMWWPISPAPRELPARVARAGASAAGERGGYVIRVRGQLSAVWAARFSDWEFSLLVDERSAITTLASGPAVDQAQLHAALRQIRDLGLELLSVQRREPGG